MIEFYKETDQTILLQFKMDNILELCDNINKCCQKIAERDGFILEKNIGGFIKQRNKFGGSWSFVEGKGKYIKKNGVMQWQLE